MDWALRVRLNGEKYQDVASSARKSGLIFEAIQFFCEASYDGRGRERGDSYTECIRISD